MRKVNQLTAKKCEQALATGKPYFLIDGDGLMLRVSETGSKSWVLRYRLDGKRTDIGLGSLNRVTLAEARGKAREMHQKIDAGIDVVATVGKLATRKARMAARAAQRQQEAEEAKARVTFRQAAEEYLKETHSSRSVQSANTWHQSLRDFVYLHIGDMAVSAIEAEDVYGCLKPHWEEKAPTLMKTRGRIEAILDFATVRKYRSGENPARWDGNLEFRLTAPDKLAKKEHQPALPWQDMPAFMGELRAKAGNDARALEFTILTATRTNEAVEADWSEIDLTGRVWRIPASRMKMSRDHVVPLSEPALAILSAMPGANEREGRVFPISDKAMYKLLQTFERADPTFIPPRPITVHGFRSSFRDWAYESQHFENQIVEHCLAHVKGDAAEQAYKRGSALDKRRAVMAAWSQFCGQTEAASLAAA